MHITDAVVNNALKLNALQQRPQNPLDSGNQAPPSTHQECALASAQQPQMEPVQRKPWRPQKSHRRKRHHKGSGRWRRQWSETINTQTPQSLHGHQKYRECHRDRKKYNWALRVHNMWVKCTACRHFLDVGQTDSVMCECACKRTGRQLISWEAVIENFTGHIYISR